MAARRVGCIIALRCTWICTWTCAEVWAERTIGVLVPTTAVEAPWIRRTEAARETGAVTRVQNASR
eukprot:575928-Alexandrium_andersonii.AAC.1